MEGHSVSVLNPVTFVVSCHSTGHWHTVWLMENIESFLSFFLVINPAYCHHLLRRKKTKITFAEEFYSTM
jgi:hypothetical protein